MSEHDSAWVNRITRRAHVDPRELKPHPANFREHGDMQREVAAEQLEATGWLRGVLVNERTGYMLNGHMRRELAIERGEKTVPVLYVDLDENQELIALATFDAVARMAATDAGKLQALRERAGIQSGDPLQALIELAMKDAIEGDSLPAGYDTDSGRDATYDRYESSDTRQIHLPLLAAEYEAAREALDRIEEAIDAKRNADCLFWLLERDKEAMADVS